MEQGRFYWCMKWSNVRMTTFAPLAHLSNMFCSQMLALGRKMCSKRPCQLFFFIFIVSIENELSQRKIDSKTICQLFFCKYRGKASLIIKKPLDNIDCVFIKLKFDCYGWWLQGSNWMLSRPLHIRQLKWFSFLSFFYFRIFSYDMFGRSFLTLVNQMGLE